MKRRFWAALVVLCLGHSANAAPVSLSAEQQKNLGIEAVALTESAEVPLAVLPAMVTPVADGRVAVAVPFAGVIVRVNVVEGQEVDKGAPLASLFSRDFLAAQSTLSQDQAEYRVTQAEVARLKLLLEGGIIPGARLDEAQARLAQTKARFDAQKRLVLTAKAEDQSSGAYQLIAPIQGRVSKISAHTGLGLDAMSSAFVIDQTDQLWLEAHLPADLSDAVHPGQTVEVEGQVGKIIAVGSAVDPKSRSLVLRAEIKGDDSLLPGSAVTLIIKIPTPEHCFEVPRAAVTKIAGQDVVFADEGGAYRAVPIQVLGHGLQTLSISGALKPSDHIVISGVSELKSLAGQN